MNITLRIFYQFISTPSILIWLTNPPQLFYESDLPPVDGIVGTLEYPIFDVGCDWHIQGCDDGLLIYKHTDLGWFGVKHLESDEL